MSSVLEAINQSTFQDYGNAMGLRACSATENFGNFENSLNKSKAFVSEWSLNVKTRHPPIDNMMDPVAITHCIQTVILSLLALLSVMDCC
jgi:hypothetical protein